MASSFASRHLMIAFFPYIFATATLAFGGGDDYQGEEQGLKNVLHFFA